MLITIDTNRVARIININDVVGDWDLMVKDLAKYFAKMDKDGGCVTVKEDFDAKDFIKKCGG